MRVVPGATGLADAGALGLGEYPVPRGTEGAWRAATSLAVAAGGDAGGGEAGVAEADASAAVTGHTVV